MPFFGRAVSPHASRVATFRSYPEELARVRELVRNSVNTMTSLDELHLLELAGFNKTAELPLSAYFQIRELRRWPYSHLRACLPGIISSDLYLIQSQAACDDCGQLPHRTWAFDRGKKLDMPGSRHP